LRRSASLHEQRAERIKGLRILCRNLAAKGKVGKHLCKPAFSGRGGNQAVAAFVATEFAFARSLVLKDALQR